MDLKQIKKQPFAKFEEDSMVRWKVTVREPVVDGERLLVVDFLKNEGNTAAVSCSFVNRFPLVVSETYGT